MMIKQIELELQVALHWAAIGNIERTTLHVDLAKKYLLELANNENAEKNNGEMSCWKNKSGRVIGTDTPPGDDWKEITRAEYKSTLEG